MNRRNSVCTKLCNAIEKLRNFFCPTYSLFSNTTLIILLEISLFFWMQHFQKKKLHNLQVYNRTLIIFGQVYPFLIKNDLQFWRLIIGNLLCENLINLIVIVTCNMMILSQIEKKSGGFNLFFMFFLFSLIGNIFSCLVCDLKFNGSTSIIYGGLGYLLGYFFIWTLNQSNDTIQNEIYNNKTLAIFMAGFLVVFSDFYCFHSDTIGRMPNFIFGMIFAFFFENELIDYYNDLYIFRLIRKFIVIIVIFYFHICLFIFFAFRHPHT